MQKAAFLYTCTVYFVYIETQILKFSKVSMEFMLKKNSMKVCTSFIHVIFPYDTVFVFCRKGVSHLGNKKWYKVLFIFYNWSFYYTHDE